VDASLTLVLVLLAALLGAVVGFLAGLVPGLHVNNVALLLVAFQAPLFAGIAAVSGLAPSDPSVPLALASLVVAAAIAHSFASFLPAVFLGAPEEETALSVLPGHRMLRQGRGPEAVHLAAWGGVLGLVGALLLLLPLRLLMGDPVSAYEEMRWAVGAGLLMVALLLVLSERGREGPRWSRSLRCLTPRGILRVDVPAAGVFEALSGEDTAVTVRGIASAITGRRFTLADDTGAVAVECAFDPEVREEESVTVRGFLRGTERRSTGRQRLLALSLFALAGALGSVVLGARGLWAGASLLPVETSQAALLPLFVGLFGLPTLLLSRSGTTRLPPQEAGEFRLPLWRRVRGAVSGCVAGATVAWFPGVSGGAATMVARQLAGGDEERGDSSREFLLSNAAVNVTVTLFSVVVLFVTGKTRSGAAAAVGAVAGSSMSPWSPPGNVPMLLAATLLAALVAAAVAFPLTLRTCRAFARLVPRAPWRRVTEAVIAFLLALVVLTAGAPGLLVLVTATGIGILPPLLGVRRVHLMGCLVAPILFGS